MPNNVRRKVPASEAATNRDAAVPAASNNTRQARATEQLAPVDRQILRLLRQNARIPNNAMAAQIGVAPSTCLGRTRGLEQRGVVRGYHADIDLRAVGLPVQAMIAVRLRAGARDRLREFTDMITGRSEVVSAFFMGGHEDFLIHVAVADTEALRDFVTDVLSGDPEVAATQTNLIFEHVPGAALR